MESIKNRETRNKFLLCFRPVTMDGSLKPDPKGDPVLTYIAVGNEDGVMIPTILTSLSEEKLNGDVAGRRRKKCCIRNFSRIMKAVLVNTALAKKIRNRRFRKDPYRSNGDLSSKSERVSSSIDEKAMHRESSSDIDDRRVNSTSSSCSSPTASNSRSLFERKRSFRSNSIESKQRNECVQVHRQSSNYGRSNSVESKHRHERVQGHRQSSNCGLCMLLISLLVLIFWGRVCAICCTCTWLFFVTRRSNGHDSPENGIESPEIDSMEYKKKIIMEGLLERNRNRL